MDRWKYQAIGLWPALAVFALHTVTASCAGNEKGRVDSGNRKDDVEPLGCPTVAWTNTHVGSSANGIALDKNGNVYVVGRTGKPHRGIWVNKYDPSGVTVWTRTHNSSNSSLVEDEGNGIAVDDAGNVHVVGSVVDGSVSAPGNGRDIWVRKYNASGKTLWTKQYSSTTNGGYDEGHGIAVDKVGNVYVTGFVDHPVQDQNIWVNKYDSNGNTVWTQTHDYSFATGEGGNGVALDKNGNVYVTGFVWENKYKAIWTRKYDNNGKTIWTDIYDGKGWDCGSAISVDHNGNAYVTGYTETGTGTKVYDNIDIWIRKYDTDGKPLWTQTYSGSSGFGDAGKGIATDNSGNVYVTGYTWVAGEDYNIWTRKYDSGGNSLWTQTFASENSVNSENNERSYGIAVDKVGNVFVAGFAGSFAMYTSWIRKYSQAGCP